MPELPDVMVYLDALQARLVGQPLVGFRIVSPFVLRSVSPPPGEFEGCLVTGLRRIGKRLVLEFESDRFLVVHLMIAGRFQWKPASGGAPTSPKGRNVLATLLFPNGLLVLTEAGSKKRASIHLVAGVANLAAFDRGGLEVLDASLEAFRDCLTVENHTVKRALTDPRLFSGIGNAYSDEILHAARLSPLVLTSRLTDEQISRLWMATSAVLTMWLERLRAETGTGFPAKVTAFRPDMAVHGRFGQPCPVCHAPVQRIVYAANECNYCATCQTGGRLLADRAMSRLLKKDWPRSLDDWDAHLDARRRSD